jgi:hypothetical protein
MIRPVMISTLLALTVAGCAAGNPAATSVATDAVFSTKLLNLQSIGNQAASQVNYIPNTQLSQATQAITLNTAAQFPIASLVGTGAAAAANAAAQTITNNTAQTQGQNQLVL